MNEMFVTIKLVIMYVLYLLFISCCTSVIAAPNLIDDFFTKPDDFQRMIEDITETVQIVPYLLEDTYEYFHGYKNTYNISYGSKEKESKKYYTFKDNLIQLNKLNNQSVKALFGITKFMDLTPEEFRERHTGFAADFSFSDGSPEFRSPSVPGNCGNIMSDQIQANNRMPATYDWYDSGCVTPVKTQGICNSCYAFATAGIMETQHCLTNGKLVNLAPQQIVDCDKLDGGCNRGFPTRAIGEVKRMGGIMAEQDYPYTGMDPGQSGRGCQFDQSKVQTTPTECYNIYPQDLTQMATTVYSLGPVVVTLCSQGMQFYTGGYLDGCCDAGPIDHVAIATGYGVAFGEQVVIKIKNTWGTGWGYGGYGYVGGRRACGIFDWPAMSARVAKI